MKARRLPEKYRADNGMFGPHCLPNQNIGSFDRQIVGAANSVSRTADFADKGRRAVAIGSETMALNAGALHACCPVAELQRVA